MRAIHPVRILAVGVLLAGLSACTPGTPVADPSAGGTSTPKPTGTVTAIPTATPTPTVAPPAAFVIDCNSIIPQSRRDWLATSDWAEFTPDQFFAKVRSEVETSPFILMQDNGGIVCPYSTGFEITVGFGYSPLADSQVGEAVSLIDGTGDHYTASSYAGGTLYTSGTEGNPFELFLIVPGKLFVASNTEILDEMLATVP